MRNGGLALALFAASCGGGGGTVPLSEFGARFVKAQCARVFRCCSVAQVQALYNSSVTDESTCVAELTPIGELVATQIGQQQAAGRLRYDGVAAAACFQKLGSAPCTAASDDQSVIAECDAYTVPLVATGGVCDDDYDCQTGFCDLSLTSPGGGLCAVVPAKGMACTSRCVPGAACDTVAGTCVDTKPDGSSCLADDDCLSGKCNGPNLRCVAPAGPTCGPAP